MLRDDLIRDIASAEAKIASTQQSTVFSEEYKGREIALQTAHIANLRNEVAGFDKLFSQQG